MCKITKENDSLQRQTENKDEDSQKIVCNENVPKLRFPEFEEEWKEHEFGTLFTIKNGLNKGKEYFNHGTPILNYIDVNKRIFNSKNTIEGTVEVSAEEIKRYCVKNNDLFLTRTSETSDEIGLTSSYNGDSNNTVFSGFILRARPKKQDINSLFYAYYLRTNKMRFNIIKYSSITTRALINSKNLSKMRVKLPDYNEQKKISTFLSAIDKKIGFMEKKHTLYQNIKKYYLENLFPKENETIPNLRFLEFNNDWIKTTLGNCVIFLDEKRIPLNQQIRSQMLSKYPYYGAAGIIDYVNNYIFDDELILLGEDGSIIPTLASGKCWVSNHAHVLKNKKNINLYFLYNILSKIHFEKYNTGTIQPKLNKKTAKNIKIKITSKKEQEKIVDFMLSIGTKIKKIQKQIKFLKTFKKGLLQKMFC